MQRDPRFLSEIAEGRRGPSGTPHIIQAAGTPTRILERKDLFSSGTRRPITVEGGIYSIIFHCSRVREHHIFFLFFVGYLFRSGVSSTFWPAFDSSSGETSAIGFGASALNEQTPVFCVPGRKRLDAVRCWPLRPLRFRRRSPDRL